MTSVLRRHRVIAITRCEILAMPRPTSGSFSIATCGRNGSNRLLLRSCARLARLSLPLLALSEMALAAPFAYIANTGSDDISVIDTATNLVVATVPVGSGPSGVAVNTAGTRVYVANSGSDDVSVIDAARNTVLARVPVGHQPVGVAVNPAGTRVYVTNFSDEERTVSVIDTANNVVIATVPLGSNIYHPSPWPYGVVVNPAGTLIYVTTVRGPTVGVINAANYAVGTFGVGASVASGIAINPNGTRIYVADQHALLVFATTGTLIATIPVGDTPIGVAVNPAGTRVYAANLRSNSVSVIDTATNTVVATVDVGSGPEGLAVTPNGMRVYVTNSSSNSVSVIDTVTNAVVATIRVGSRPDSLGLFIGPAPAGANATTDVPTLSVSGLIALSTFMGLATLLVVQRRVTVNPRR